MPRRSVYCGGSASVVIVRMRMRSVLPGMTLALVVVLSLPLPAGAPVLTRVAAAVLVGDVAHDLDPLLPLRDHGVGADVVEPGRDLELRQLHHVAVADLERLAPRMVPPVAPRLAIGRTRVPVQTGEQEAGGDVQTDHDV